MILLLFFFNDTATTEIYTLSLHDALPIYQPERHEHAGVRVPGAEEAPLEVGGRDRAGHHAEHEGPARSEEHTSELQSRQYLVCRLLLEKKKQTQQVATTNSNAAELLNNPP